VDSLRYLPQQLEIEVEGYAAEQAFEMLLEPAWAVVSITSSPDGAEILVDGSVLGLTPIHAEILQGQHEIRLQKPGFKPLILFRSVAAGQDFSLGNIQLEPVDGKLTVNSVPAGASILIDGKFLGITPQTLELAAEMEHKLSLSKTGFKTASQDLRLKPDEERVIAVELEIEYGTVFLKPLANKKKHTVGQQARLCQSTDHGNPAGGCKPEPECQPGDRTAVTGTATRGCYSSLCYHSCWSDTGIGRCRRQFSNGCIAQRRRTAGK